MSIVFTSKQFICIDMSIVFTNKQFIYIDISIMFTRKQFIYIDISICMLYGCDPGRNNNALQYNIPIQKFEFQKRGHECRIMIQILDIDSC
jgi:hypothetical protein